MKRKVNRQRNETTHKYMTKMVSTENDEDQRVMNSWNQNMDETHCIGEKRNLQNNNEKVRKVQEVNTKLKKYLKWKPLEERWIKYNTPASLETRGKWSLIVVIINGKGGIDGCMHLLDGWGR